MVFNATLTIFQLYRGCQFYWWRKPEYPEKTIDLLQVTDSTFAMKTGTIYEDLCSQDSTYSDILKIQDDLSDIRSGNLEKRSPKENLSDRKKTTKMPPHIPHH